MVVHPCLRRELDAGGSLEGAKRNFLNVSTVMDRGRKQGLIADVFLVVHQPRLDVDPTDASGQPDSSRKPAIRERVRDGELGENRPATNRSVRPAVLIAEVRLAGLRHTLLVGHGNEAGAIEATIEFPQIALVLFPRYNVRRSGKHFPSILFVEQAGRLAG